MNDSFKKYAHNNASLNSNYKRYNAEIPKYLHDWPAFFIRHVYERLKTAENVYSSESIVTLNYENKTMFLVRSENDEGKQHIVDISLPKCSYYDFYTFRFPCKHVLAITLFVPGYHFDPLPITYRVHF